MGYQTTFTIRLIQIGDYEPTPPDLAILKTELEAESRYEFDEEAGELGATYKWYEYEADVSAVSRRLPGFAIEVEGDGEDAGDLWRQRFRDGRAGPRVKGHVVYEWDAAEWPEAGG